jgi:hypothetical protein
MIAVGARGANRRDMTPFLPVAADGGRTARA